jgi:DNA-binding CsgD family transcriptional regulator
MKKSDKEIEEIMAISPGTIRTIKARIKLKRKA